MEFSMYKEIDLFGFRFFLIKSGIKVICAKAVNIDEVRSGKGKEIRLISKTGKLLEFYNLKDAKAERI